MKFHSHLPEVNYIEQLSKISLVKYFPEFRGKNFNKYFFLNTFFLLEFRLKFIIYSVGNFLVK